MKIVGITIGPIGDTVSLAKSPAMLWYASSLFSRFSFVICKNIKENIKDADLLVPFIDDETLKNGIASTDGIGKYHDRIIFKAENVDKISEIILNSKNEIATMIKEDLKDNDTESVNCVEFIINYIQAHYVVLDEEKDNDKIKDNVILSVSDYLDALEQMKTFNPDNTNNPIIKLFNNKNNNDDKGRNYTIKTCKMLKEVGKVNSQLMSSGNKLKNIDDIAGYTKSKNANEETKEKSINDKGYKYYAVIQADGDKMSDFLKSVKDDETIKEFSKSCIQYASTVSKVIDEYGGMTVYAGGDDLLALAPVISLKSKENIFDLCKKINDCFEKNILKENGVPTLSIGVTIRYLHFPLYEALGSAGDALFSVAKNAVGKNCVAVDFQKHSGQSIKIKVPMEKLEFVKGVLKTELDSTTNTEKDEKAKEKEQEKGKKAEIETVNSLIYILDTFKGMFKDNPSEAIIKNIFNNLYDNSSQKKYKNYVGKMATKLAELYAETERNIRVYGIDDITPLKTFEGLLRIKKFITEEVYND